jgi:hypothetical protein
MLDLLAAIVSSDPPALLAWLILAFAAGMYPVGIMLGSSCSPCCNSNPCTQCTQGELPETLTVTFNGLQDRTPGPDLCLLTFSAPYGSGAAGKVTAPGGDPATDKGPISAVSLTSGGSGYAKLGRVAPTITATGGTGTGATFTVSKTSANDANGIPSWGVTGVTWTGSTSGYVDGDQITFDVAAGDTAEQGAAATIRTVRTAPTVTASASGGSGATFGVTIAPNGTTPQTWSVTGVTVTNGGTGYPASGYLNFDVASGDTEEQSADVVFYSGRVAPTVSATAGGYGTGAVLSASLASATGWDGQTYWYLSGVSITNGGSGYAEFDPVNVNVTDGEGYGAYAEVTSVDGSGAITGIAVYWGGEYYKSNGIIQSVEFGYGGGGIYYRDPGQISSISVEAGGKYYREDASASPYVATVTVGVSQTAPSNGTGATLTATVESSTSSANFGKITGVSISSGGNNYLAWQWRNTKCCGWYWNGKPVVLKRLNYGSGDACYYQHRMCGGWNNHGAKGLVALQYNGPNAPPTLSLLTELSPELNPAQQCNTSFAASGNVTNCSDWSGVSFSASGGATATVSAGGEYDTLYKANNSCHPCCQGEEDVPQEIEAQLQWSSGQAELPPDGTYVLSRFGAGLGWAYGQSISVTLGLCSEDCDQCIKKCETLVYLDNLADQRTCGTSSQCVRCTVDAPSCAPSGAFHFDNPLERQVTMNQLGGGSIPLHIGSPPQSMFLEWKQQQAGVDPCQAENTYWSWVREHIPYDGPCNSYRDFVAGRCGGTPSGMFFWGGEYVWLNYYKFFSEHESAPADWTDPNTPLGTEADYQFYRNGVLQRWTDRPWKGIATITINP